MSFARPVKAARPVRLARLDRCFVSVAGKAAFAAAAKVIASAARPYAKLAKLYVAALGTSSSDPCGLGSR